jgi:2-phosphoglycerate kinase
MTEGHDRHVWSVVSAIMALTANCHRDSKSRILEPDDFNPTLTKQERLRNMILITDENVEIMRNDFKKAFS